MNIKQILQRKAELESFINVIDNHMARAGAGGTVTVSVDGFYSVHISAPEADSILSGKRALHLQELGRINRALDTMEKVAGSLLADGEDGRVVAGRWGS